MGIGAILSIIGGVAVGIFTAISYVNMTVQNAIAPVSAQSATNSLQLTKQTALLVVIAQKVGIPSAEVTQILDGKN